MRHNSSAIFHLKPFMLGTKVAHQSANFQTFGCSQTKFLCYFTSHESVLLYILRYPSVSWHVNPLKFSSWNVTCFGQKEPIKVQSFRLLSALMNSPTSSCHFKNWKVRVHSNFGSLFSVRYKNDRLLFCTFLSRYFVSFGQKEPIKVQDISFNCSREISPNFHFDRLLLLKVFQKNNHFQSWGKRDTGNMKDSMQ